ncbi:MAG: T9SS type A sorting domain-containing protein [Bacteroidales bacterium]|nr:T9SS type A sorting domain-containing protein [Bacteroidales bacterium]
MKTDFYLSGNIIKIILMIIMFFPLAYLEKLQAQPSQGATNFSVSNVEGDRFRVNWVSGTGERRIVLASDVSDFYGSGIPVDGVDYNANNSFGQGDQIGTGNFVVYKGTGANVTVNNLDSSSTYYFRIYEYNGNDFQTLYNTDDVLEGNGTTLSAPLTGPDNLIVSDIFGNRASMSWDRGDGNRNLVILRQGAIPGEPVLYQSYNGSSIFGNGSAVGGGRAIIAGTQNSVNITSLQPNTWYYTRILEYNGVNYPVYSYGTALVDSFMTATKPTIGSTNASISNVQGNRFTLGFTSGDGTRRLIVVRQDEPVDWIPADGLDYNDNANFGQGDDLGNNTFVVGRITGSSRGITNLTPSTVYHYAVFEFNGTDNNTWYLTEPDHVLTGQVETLSAPTVQGGNFEFSDITGNSMSVSFSPGNGSGRILLVRAGSPVEDIPLNLVSYSSNSNFNNAPSIGSSKIVYRGSGTGVNLTALQPDTEYHFALFEYNGSTGPVYNQNNPGVDSVSTLGAPTVPPSNLTYSNIQGNRMTLGYNEGNGIGRIVIARQGAPVNAFPQNNVSYNASTNFGIGHDLGNGNYVIQNSTSGSTSVTGLVQETTYHFAIIEYNGSGENRLYMIPDSALTGSRATLFPPEVQASELSFTDITPNSVRINWTNGNGNGRIVLIRPGQPVTDLPNDLTSYSSNSNYSNSPSIGSSRIVYRGSGNTVNVTNIPPGEYHVAILEYNGSTGPVYRRVDPLTGQVLVGGPPEIPASNISFSNIQGNRFTTSFTTGDGISRMIIARQGSPVNAWPVDGNSYTANSTFGNGAHLGNGNYVVYSGTGLSASILGLQPQTTYHIAIVEFNGSGATSFYQNPDIVATASRSTLFPPIVPTSSIFANNVTGNRMQLTWTRGDGTGRIVIGRMGQEVNQYPEDLFSPSTHSNFGNGYHFGNGNYALYAGTGDNFNLTGLEPDTTYHFAFMEYNGTSGRVYLRDTIARAAFKTAERPFVPASNLAVSNRNGDRLTVNFTTGNGARRLIVFKKDDFVDALPEDFTTYATGFFGEGAEIGNGNYVVGIATGTSSLIRGLEPDTRYGVAVFEYDGSNGNERYMVNEYLTGFVRTSSPPDIPPTGLIISSVGNSGANLSWTNGSGERRMVIMRPFQPVTFQPETLNSHGSSSTNFNSTFNHLGEGHRHVYRGANDNITLSNMEPGVTYHIAIYEYNGPNQPVYGQVPLTGFFTTLPEQGIVIGGFDAITFCPGQTFAVPYFYAGNLNSGNVISVELSDQNGDFTNPTLLGAQNTTNSQGFVSASLPLSLPQGSGYRLRALASDPEEISPDNGADLTVSDPPIPEIVVEGESTESCGEPVLLSVSQPGYLIQWYRNGAALPFGTGSTWLAQVSGSYQVGIYGASEGCETLSEAVLINISEAPEFVLPLDDVYCMDQGAVSLENTEPQGGIFTGPGISGNFFDPSLAGVGQHLINYTYVDPETQCEFSTTQIVLVAALPVVNLVLPFETISQLDNPIPLDMGEPAGGVYFLGNSQEIITAINPSQLEPGEYWLFYEFTNDNGCLGIDSAQFFITEPAQMVFAPELDAVCQNFGLLDLPDGEPEGGTWSGEFVIDNTFDTEAAGSGDFWLSYTVELQDGFFQSDSALLTVLPLTFTELSVILCEGSVYEIGDETFTESGLYTIILGEAANGCDSVLYLDLNIGHPDLTITQDIVVYLDENGEVSISPDDVYNGSLSGWDIESMTLNIQDFSCEDIGENAVYLTITDENGNQACGSALVTIEDNLPPVVLTQNITVELDENGEAFINATDIDNGSTDNCGIESLELNITGFTCANVGENTVILTVTDVNGNSAEATATVTVQDNLPPVVIVMDITVELDGNGEALITAEDVDNGSTDNCGIESMELDITGFNCENVGINEVTLTVTDVNGNSGFATAQVTVVDNLPPVVITQNIVIQLDETGEAAISPADIDNGSFDNCGIESMELDVYLFTSEDAGENTVTLNVFDVNGNSASETAVVTVLEFIADTYILTLIAEPVEGGTVDGGGQYEAEEEITLSAVASEGYVFLRWEDEDGIELSTEAQFVFTMPDSDVTLTAFFDLENTVGDVFSSHLKLFPNPATEQVNIHAGFVVNALRVTDITGKAVYFSNSVHSDEYQLNVSGFEPGIYLVSLQHDKGVVTVRLMVTR